MPVPIQSMAISAPAALTTIDDSSPRPRVTASSKSTKSANTLALRPPMKPVTEKLPVC